MDSSPATRRSRARRAREAVGPVGDRGPLLHDDQPQGHRHDVYLWFGLFNFFAGGIMALIVRAELFMPGLQVINPSLYNQLITLHGAGDDLRRG